MPKQRPQPKKLRATAPGSSRDETKPRLLLAGYDPAATGYAPVSQPGHPPERPLIFIVDHDHEVRDRIRTILVQSGWTVEDRETPDDYLEACRLHPPGETCRWSPAIVIASKSDMSMAIQVIKISASNFISKPVKRDELLLGLERALEWARSGFRPPDPEEFSGSHISRLTPRQVQIMELVLAGHPSKNIAADLGISRRTVENHRSAIMKKTGVKSLPALTRLALATSWNATDTSAPDE